MFPPQTSLIPVQVALARFLETSNLAGMFANYPYWYLGSTPFRFLSGILPPFLAILHGFLPGLNLFEIMFAVLALGWVLGGVGVFFLVREMAPLRPSGFVRGAGNWVALVSAIFYLFGPIVPFLFRFSDGIYLLAFSLVPWILFKYLQTLKTQKQAEKHGICKVDFLLCFLIIFAILIDTQIIPTLIFGMIAIFLSLGTWKGAEEKIKSSLVFLFFSFLVATLWYSPAYWWTLLGAPSFGGKGLISIIELLGKLLPAALALALALISGKRSFAFYWLFIFGFLTLFRFLSDPDFWLDWTSYGLELQLGLAVLVGLMINRWAVMRMQANDKRIYANERITYFVLCTLLFVLWLFVFNSYVLGTLQKDINQSVEYKIGKYLNQTAKQNERVFLSGTTAFWLNAFFDIPQVRGGRDQASTDPDWRKGVWEIRDGSASSPQAGNKSVEWLKKLDIAYLVVHTQESKEYWHDFKDPEKFEDIKSLKKVFEEKGDIIYRVE